MIIIDIIIIAIIASSFVYGYKKGLIDTLTSIVGFFLALILAFAFSNSVASYFKGSTPVYNEIKTSVKSAIELLVDVDDDDKDKEDKNAEEENEEAALEEESGLFSNIKEELISAGKDKKEELVAEYTEKISMYILKSISFIIIFILVSIIVTIVGLMLNGVFSLPILDSVNKIAGMCANGLISILRIQIVLAIIYLVSGFSIISGVIKIINQTTFVNLLYNNNIIVFLLEKLFN